MEREPIVPDNTVYRLPINDSEELLNPKYDRIDYFQGFGHYVLRVAQVDGNQHAYHIDEDVARQILDQSDLPMALRPTMCQSEYDGYLRYKTKKLDDSWLE